MEDRIRLAIRGELFEGWTTAHVVRSIDAVAGAFAVTLSERYADRMPANALRSGDEVKITVGDDVVLTGYIDEIAIQSGPDGVAVEISGRDKTGDLVDCAPDLPPGQWKNITLLRLAEILCEPFGIEVTSEVDTGPPFPEVALANGETAWDLLEERARYRAVLAMSDARGGLLLTQAGKAGRGDPLVHGSNLLESSLVNSSVDRYEHYIVKGQSPGRDSLNGVPAAGPVGRGIDAEARKGRVLVLVASSGVDAGRCKKRADYEATVRAGRANRIAGTVVGWRQASGALWVPNLQCAFESAPLGVNEDLVVSQVTLSQESDSRKTILDLVRPDAYAPQFEPVKGPAVKKGSDPFKGILSPAEAEMVRKR